MPKEVPEMSDLPGGDPLLSELPGDCSVMCGDTSPLRGGSSLRPRVITVVRIGVDGGVVESCPVGVRQPSLTRPSPVADGAFNYCLVGDR